MIDAEEIDRKARILDEPGRIALAEFLDFLLTRHRIDSAGTDFAPTEFESDDAPSVYQGPPLSLEQMRAAIDWVGGEAR